MKVVKNAAGISINQWFVQVDVLARLGIVGIVNHLCLHSLCNFPRVTNTPHSTMIRHINTKTCNRTFFFHIHISLLGQAIIYVIGKKKYQFALRCYIESEYDKQGMVNIYSNEAILMWTISTAMKPYWCGHQFHLFHQYISVGSIYISLPQGPVFLHNIISVIYYTRATI